MPTATGTYEQIDGSPVVRFERTFPHPVRTGLGRDHRPRVASRSGSPRPVEFDALRAGAPITFRFDRRPLSRR